MAGAFLGRKLSQCEELYQREFRSRGISRETAYMIIWLNDIFAALTRLEYALGPGAEEDWKRPGSDDDD